MILQVYVQHHQQALISHYSWRESYTTSSNYRNAYDSLDVGVGFEWKASASGEGSILGGIIGSGNIGLGLGLKLSVAFRHSLIYVV